MGVEKVGEVGEKVNLPCDSSSLNPDPTQELPRKLLPMRAKERQTRSHEKR